MLVVGARCSSRSKIQSSRIAELIVLACHEFMDGKLWSNPLTAPTVPIEDADVLRIRWQSEAMPDAAANRANPCNTTAKSLRTSRCLPQCKRLRHMPHHEAKLRHRSGMWRTTRLRSWGLALTFLWGTPDRRSRDCGFRSTCEPSMLARESPRRNGEIG